MLGRKISIDKEKCDGCGLCITACHEGAIELVDGKAELVRENVCDGLGDCLPACPQGAITFRDPEPQKQGSGSLPVSDPSACLMANPGYQWPIQIALVHPKSDFFRGTLVVGADCTAFTMDDFKRRFVANNPVIALLQGPLEHRESRGRSHRQGHRSHGDRHLPQRIGRIGVQALTDARSH